MRKRSLLLMAIIGLAVARPAIAQATFVPGDVLVSGYRETIHPEGFPTVISNIRVFGRDGVFKRELITGSRLFSEPYVRNNIVFVGRRDPNAIERIDAGGNLLTPFTTLVRGINYLSPGPGGGLLAASAGDIYQFASDGTLIRYRDLTTDPLAGGGIDLASDQCTVIQASNGALARWNACLGTPAQYFTPSLPVASGAVRVLPDGTFLVALLSRVVHQDAAGNVIREYSVPSSESLALDIDGTSFWANAGNYLLRIDIASGAVLSQTFTEFSIFGISVVGEPRAGHAGQAIPTASTLVLFVFALSLAFVAALRLRLG